MPANRAATYKEASPKLKTVRVDNVFRNLLANFAKRVDLGIRIDFAWLLGAMHWREGVLKMSRDFIAWDALDLHLDSGISGSEEHRQTILDVTKKAIQDGNRDPKRVIQAAKRVGRRAHLVENLRAYAMRAIFRVKSKPSVTQVREEQLFTEDSLSDLTDRAQVDQIENRILLRELLETLSPQDREIFLRSMEGETAPEIDTAMNLRPRTAEGRLRICKNALRKVLEEKSNRTTYTRGS